MTSRSSHPRLATAVLGALCLLSASLLPGGIGLRPLSGGVVPAAAATGPSLTLLPSATGLIDQQYVKVVMAGFPPSSLAGGFGFRECIATPKTLGTDCTGTYNVSGIADEQGNGSTYLPIYAGNDPGLKSADGSTTLVCDFGHACTMTAFLDVKSIDLTRAVFAPMSFARSPDACPAGQNGVLGSGSATAYRAIYAWQSDVCLPPHNLAVDYTVHNSHDGWTQFQNGQTDFGVTGTYPAPTPDPSAKPPTYQFAPLSASGLVLAYRIYARGGAQITSLTLTPDMIAGIFSGNLYNWSRDPAINALNPDVATAGGFPGIIHPMVRAEFSSETYVFTSWLTRYASASWHVFDFATGAYRQLGVSDVFPSGPLDTGNYKTSARGVALAVVDPTTPWDSQGNIGFMDSSTAAFYGLPTASIKLADGVVAATPATIAKAITDATVNTDGTITADPALHADAWPMPLPTYMLAPTNTITPDKGATLASFLTYAVQDGQKALPAGYAPLPTNLVNASLAVAKLIPGGAPAPSPTPTPTPTPTPSPTPTPHPTPTPTPVPTAVPTFSPGPLPLLSNPGDSSSSGNGGATTASPSPAAGSVAGATPNANQHAAAVPLGQGAQLVAVIQGQDTAGARYLIPGLALLGLLSLLGGAIAQALARRRSRP